MKTGATPQLLALLATRQFVVADLWTWILADGEQIFMTSGDKDIGAWSAGGYDGPLIERAGSGSRLEWTVGLSTSSIEFDVLPRGGRIGEMSWAQALAAGFFDMATVVMYRAYMPTYGDIDNGGLLTMFAGEVGQSYGQGPSIHFTVNSAIERLNTELPRNLYQPGCNNVLFDSACALNRNSYAVAGVVAAGSSAVLIRSQLAQATAYFALGAIQFTTGALAGLRRTVQAYTKGNPGSILTLSPFAQPPDIGDFFLIWPGCDLTRATCLNKFNNLANFRGTPFVPTPETAI